MMPSALSFLFTFLAHSSCFSVLKKLSTGEMAVCGDQWLMLVYANQEYNEEEPWVGLFRSQLLVWVQLSDILIRPSYSHYGI
jgi:hypothetical protein